MSTNVFQNLNPDKQKRILKAIEAEFLGNDFNNIKVIDICKAADIPRSAFYRYFDSLEDAVKSFLLSRRDELIGMIETIGVDETLDEYHKDLQIFNAFIMNDDIYEITARGMALSEKNPYFNLSQGLSSEEKSIDELGARDKVIIAMAMGLIHNVASKKMSKEEAMKYFEECLGFVFAQK